VRAASDLYERLRDRLVGRPLLLLLDVDGTLSPIAPTPTAAFVPGATRSALAQLASTPGVHVALVSGRSADDARRMVAVDGAWAVGNHGFERITPAGTVEVDPAAAPWRERVANAATAAAPIVAGQYGALLENKTWTLSVHYRQAPAGAAQAMRPVLEQVARDQGLVLTEGKQVFELRPPVRIDKGTACVALTSALLPHGDGVVLYAGDDRTDEDAFRALRAARADAITIRVAPGTSEAPMASAAEFVLPDVDAMGALLALLAGSAAGPVGAG
jgi:trehalose 6-phosphate phosphatase